MTHGTDAEDTDIYRAHWSLQTLPSPLPLLNTPPAEAHSAMSPKMSCDALPAFEPNPKRKEALELRKTLKPLMEKRRRARINDSLNHLKNLILPLTGRDKSRYSKLEKADILEMTVRFLSEMPPASSKNPTESYKEGYKACLQRVTTLLPGPAWTRARASASMTSCSSPCLRASLLRA
ncbi:hypothetical protein WMY93_030478 [Mugilogobius chulae]|uniref:BHLH domain-containing protein n=1 Tax=Mugilogobius chulae TaxID=88201 RepID=A0AAW0MNH1_9GOBI